jgi:nucleoside-diphosphate-sugar epimerase
LASRSERVLVTGGNGFTGRALVGRLREAGYEVLSLSHDAAGPNTLKADLCDFDGLVRSFTDLNPNVVVHLAGIAAPSHDKVGEIYNANVVGTANLFAALLAKKVEPRLIVVASSAQVYGAANADKPLTEDSPIEPNNHYAVSKRAAEDVAGLYSRHFPITITRPFNYTGPGQSPVFIVPKVVQHYAERRTEIRVGNLDIFRDISDIRRVVEAYVRLIARTIEPTTVNICSGRAVHLADIFKIMEEVSGHAIKVVVDPSFFRTDDPRVIVGSSLRLEAMVGALPNPEFRETLVRMYEASRQMIASGR